MTVVCHYLRTLDLAAIDSDFLLYPHNAHTNAEIRHSHEAGAQKPCLVTP